MISEECFIQIMKSLIALYDKFTELDAVINLDPASSLYGFIDNILDSLSDELQKVPLYYTLDSAVCNLYGLPKKCEGVPLLLQWAFDYDFGRKYEDKYLVEINGVEYKPENAHELYKVFELLNDETNEAKISI